MSGLTQEQLAIRRTRIGGSEIGVLLGLSPHGGPIDVFMEKTLPAKERDGEQFEWGSTVEWAIIEYHAKKEGLLMERPGTLVHPDHAFVCATPDAIGLRPNIAAPEPRVIEVKNVGRWMSGEWGEEGDDAPFHYLAQVHWEMGVAIRLGLAGTTAHLVAAIAGEAPRKYEVQFDAELYGILVGVAEKFMRDHVQTGKPPPAAPAQEAEYIKRRYSKDSSGLLDPTPELSDLVSAVRATRAEVERAEAQKVVAENALKTAIGEAQGIAGLCTWKQQVRASHSVKESTSRVLRLSKLKEG